MKNMKRILAVALALVMACGLLVVPAVAVDGDVTFTVGEWTQSGNAGSVTVTITGKDGGAVKANGLGVSLKFNTDVLTFTGAVVGEDMTGLQFMGPNVNAANTNGVANASVFDVTTADHDLVAGAAVVTYNFEVKADVESCTVDFELVAADTTADHSGGAYTADLVDGKAAVKGADPTLDTVTVSPTTAPADATNNVTVTATATSTSSKDITGFVTWSVAPADGGVSVAADGKVTVDAKAKAGEYTVTATPKAGESKGDAKSATLTVSRSASVVTTVVPAAANKTTLVIPTGDQAVTESYAVDVLDQYGDKMTGDDAAATWTAGTLPTGVTFDAATATLSVVKDAGTGEVTLTATVGGQTATIKVNVTNIVFEGVAEGVKATDGVYGDKLSDMVKIDASKLTAKAGDVVAGTYTLVDADTMPAAADSVAYAVVFNSTDGNYVDIPVTEGTVKVDKKEITVTANDIDVKVGAELADIEAEKGYTNTALVGDDALEGTAAYKFYDKNEDGTKGAEATISTEEPVEYFIEVSGLTASANYDVKFVDGTLTVSKKSSLRPPIGQGTNPDGTEKDPVKDPDNTDKLVFDDVAETDWFYDAVNYVAENGLMNGVAEKTFSPNANTTRAMIATILWRQAGSPEPVARIADFPDVDPEAWYIKAVRWCAEKEIVTGYDNGNFGPNDEITREQLAVMFYRYAGSPEVDAAMGMAGFNDVDAISDWAADAMRWAVQNGIINGMEGGMLVPQGLATRAQTAAVLQRYLTKK